ncbi:hypothetical protein EBZ35_06350, partial [bacterium]|nr:hypothetical protein [bacterium]
MRPHHRRRRWWVGVTLLVAILAGGGWYWSGVHHGPPLVTVDVSQVPAKITMANGLRLTIRPVMVSNRSVSFKVKMESYQNTDPIRANPQDIMLLTIQDDIPFRDAVWASHSQQAYAREGTITFTVDRLPTLIRLSIFEMEERLGGAN